MIRVLLADDHAIIRQLMRQMLEKEGDIQVVSLASNGQEAVKEVLVHCPDVAVMDLSMPIMNGVEAARQISSRCPHTHILIVSAFHTPWYIRRSIEAGVWGYVVKDAVSKDLVTAVRSIHQGQQFFCKQVAAVAQLYLEKQIRLNAHHAHHMSADDETSGRRSPTGTSRII